MNRRQRGALGLMALVLGWRCQRKAYDEARSAAFRGLHFDATAARIEDASNGSEPDARPGNARAVQAVERLEDLRARLVWNPGSGVRDLDAAPVVLTLRRDRHASLLG